MRCPKCGRDKPDLNECFKNYGTCYLLEELSDEEITCLHEGKYRIVYPLREGGMSTLYLGKDLTDDGSRCVIKELYEPLLSSEEKEAFASMFEVEAFMLLTLNHPAIPSIKDFFIEDDSYYLIMEYIEGTNLADLLYESYGEGFPQEDVLAFGIEICDILEYLHSHNPPIIHRDINPGNFMRRDTDGKIIMIDFGIATLFDTEGTSTLIGTPGYIAPELYEGCSDIRNDIFSLGVTLHELLTGKNPAENIPFEFEPVRTIKSGISEGLEEIIQKALMKDIDERFIDAKEMKKKLYRALKYLKKEIF